MPKEESSISLEEQEKIIHAKQEWTHTFDAVSDLIFIVDNDLNFVRVNRSMAEHCGCRPNELVGRKCYEVMHGTKCAPVECLHAKVIELREPQTAEFVVEKLKGIFEVTMSPMFNTDGQITATVHVARDISEKRRQEKLLAKQQKQLEEINSTLESRITEAVAEMRKKDDILIQQSRLTAMGEMISNIAHQWRQPLNNIGLIVQNLQLAFKSNDLSVEEMDEDIAEVMKVLQQISETIDDFRNFFSYEEKMSSFIVNELISRSLSFVEPSLKRKGILLELDEQPDIVVNGYPNEYMQAFLNIMLNARDALLDHQVTKPLISIRISGEKGRSIITVRDNGGGIDEDILPKIFDPYFTTKHQSTGVGLGLYMAKMIVEKKMHGSLEALNVEDGVEFKIEI
ncbi:MAG: PAS domain-containing sensor histidine kinase [Deltaproteobacteria bacterium]|nr:PAS domain-containing sensor histidine kinase [Deltaproteobacteria bacterium]